MVKITRFNKYKYPEPERYSPEVARERKLAGALQAASLERDRLQRVRDEALFQVRKKTVNLSRTIVKDREEFGPKAGLIAAALAKFSESDFADPEKRKAYRALRARQEGLRKVKASAGDLRNYHPEKGTDEHGFAQTIYGGVARIGAVHARGPHVGWLPNFHVPTSVMPCIQRAIRREVMFALGFGGKGYKTKKRRTANSGVPC